MRTSVRAVRRRGRAEVLLREGVLAGVRVRVTTSGSMKARGRSEEGRKVGRERWGAGAYVLPSLNCPPVAFVRTCNAKD
eukprot:2126929-Rhodomonas_salina.1